MKYGYVVTSFRFYHEHLPYDLQEGSLPLEERAKLAAEARIALKLYVRERCYIGGRLSAELYDGLRHLRVYRKWSTRGLSYQQIKEKYFKEAVQALGKEAHYELCLEYMYKRILQGSCNTNSIFDIIVKEQTDAELLFQTILTLITSQLSKYVNRGEGK